VKDKDQKTPLESFPEKFYQDPTGIDRYVVQEKTLFEWKAPNRVVRHHKRTEVAQSLLLVLLGTLVFALVGELFLLCVFLSFVGLYILMVSTKPSILRYQVTTIGIKIEEKYYYWSQLTQFWIEEKSETLVLHVRNIYPTVHNLRMVIHKEDEEAVRTTIGKYLLYKKPQQSQAEKLTHFLLDKLPFETEVF
jgi:hypothetical protein